ncbi:MAG: SpoIID/LytB domain-containing protein [bacterium]
MAFSAKRMVRLMARLGTAVMLVVLVYSCASVPGLREETSSSFIRVPFVRVLLEESQDSVTVSRRGQFALECLTGPAQQVYYVSKPAQVVNERGRLRVNDSQGSPIAVDLDEVNLIPRGDGDHLLLRETPYRGLLKVLPYGRNVRVINIVYMEDYLRGVVPPEIGHRDESEIEAVKAQAIAARTYAISHLQQYPQEPYDLKASIIDQVYQGAGVEDRLINRAITETAGHVLRYQGEFIQAYYHSTCGGMTDDIAAVWDRKDIPYLKPVADSGACSWSKYYTWEEHFTEAQLRGRLEQYLSSDRGRDLRIAPITDLSIAERTAGGRVARLLVRTDQDVYKFHKDRIRWVIGRTSNPDLILPSDRFDIEITRGADGFVQAVTFSGRGYGHGVGMCQCGAIGMARDNRTYEQILTHYFTGVQIEKMY